MGIYESTTRHRPRNRAAMLAGVVLTAVVGGQFLGCEGGGQDAPPRRPQTGFCDSEIILAHQQAPPVVRGTLEPPVCPLPPDVIIGNIVIGRDATPLNQLPSRSAVPPVPSAGAAR